MRMRGWNGSIVVAALFVFAPLATSLRSAAGPAVKSSECEKKAAARPTHECVSCDASVVCLERITSAGGSAEIIPIAHGLMILYNTANSKRVSDVQNAALERWEMTDQIIAGRAENHLCAACCAARTLMMRSDRQVYRTSSGVVAMVTSDDFTLVRELHRMVPKRRVVSSPQP
ncbi:MAG: hypothetical protein ABIP29_10415 [Candidatus Eisenbacteria bacterium]